MDEGHGREAAEGTAHAREMRAPSAGGGGPVHAPRKAIPTARRWAERRDDRSGEGMASRGKIVRATIALLTIALVAGAALLVSTASGASNAKQAAAAGIPDFSVAQVNASAGDNWLTTGGSLQDDRYSTLADVNAANVGSLTTAWQTHLGIPKKLQGLESQEGNPVAYNGVLYVPDGLSNVY